MLSLSHDEPAVRPTHGERAEDLRWRRSLRDAIRDPAVLCDRLGLPRSLASDAAGGEFAMLAPEGFVARMRVGDPADPLLLQVLPAPPETLGTAAGHDAVGDLPATRAPGLLHKYAGRVLLMAAGQCAVNCRYCFRRHFPYDSLPAGDAEWDRSLAVIEGDASLGEVILSGGDPLVLSDHRLAKLIKRLDRVPHLKRLRLHTRLPIVIPERVTELLCDTLRGSRLQSVVVLHTNHANEIDRSVADAVQQLREASPMVLNQSVLLRRVNDSVEALADLSETLASAGVIPYYLHQLDRVAGVEHFATSLECGERLIQGLRDRLPGYLVPRYVREEPGMPSKTPLA